jgi:hypothetical protein
VKRKKLLLTVGALSLSCAILGVLATLPGRPRLTEEQFDLIQVGMSLEEIESLLRCKPGDYTRRSGGVLPINMVHYAQEQQDRREPFKEWAADYPTAPHENANGPGRQDALAIRVWFGANGKVIDKCRMGYEYTLPSPASWFTRWIRFR